MANSGKRPISPHLSHYKWGPAMTASIMHRITGDGLAIFGSLLLVWWLGALASGPQAYASFLGWVWADLSSLSWSGLDILCSILRILIKIVFIGLTWAVISHAISGIRHLVMDTGAGFELKTNRTWSTVSIILPIFLTAALWLFILSKGL